MMGNCYWLKQVMGWGRKKDGKNSFSNPDAVLKYTIKWAIL
jgi:hypothetical protein